MIEHCKGNLLEADVEALTNPVNCIGVMGKGLALDFKKAYPENFHLYKLACNKGEVKPGAMFITTTNLTKPKYIINFPTKRHWRETSYIEDIKSGLVALVADIKSLEIQSIALPALGCGLGGLRWQDVEPLIVSAFEQLPEVQVKLYLPFVI